MLAALICKECDLTLESCYYNSPEYILTESLIEDVKKHYQLTNHTLVKLIITFTDDELKGE